MSHVPPEPTGHRTSHPNHPDAARFVFNGRPLGEIADADFARRFFGIWLDPRTSAPELRAALLRRPAG